MSDGKKTVKDLLAEIILDANALRDFCCNWALALNQFSTLEMIRDDFAGIIEDIEGR